MTAEIVSVGTELLLGQITDTNATFISEKLAERGVNVYFRQTVGDNLERLCATLRLAGSRADAVIITGGLGPTDDDITREALAGIVGVELKQDPQAAASIKAFLKARGRSVNAATLRQARVPEGGTIAPNRHGTAPGIIVEHDGSEFIALPGVPSEMHAMLEDCVLPHLEARGGGPGPIIKSRILHLSGVGESALGEMIGDILQGQSDPTIAPYAALGGVQLRITTKAASDEDASTKIARVEQQLRARLGSLVFGTDDETLEAVVGTMLAQRRLTITTAESCTGGLIANRLTDISGSSAYFVGGVVTYSNQEKARLLGVAPELMEQHGSVSEVVAKAMAVGARERSGADMAAAATGIAGPTGGTPQKPVGLVWIALATQESVICQEHRFHGARDQIKWRTSQAALNMVRLRLLGEL